LLTATAQNLKETGQADPPSGPDLRHIGRRGSSRLAPIAVATAIRLRRRIGSSTESEVRPSLALRARLASNGHRGRKRDRRGPKRLRLIWLGS
jgi:hypothetical protein